MFQNHIRVIFFFQVTQYLLDKSLIIDEDTLYELSLKIEPRLPAWEISIVLQPTENFSVMEKLCMACPYRMQGGKAEKNSSSLFH